MGLKKRSKYNARKTVVDGITFDSKKEANHYCLLVEERRRDPLFFFLRQVPFDLPGGVKYRVDFMEFRTHETFKGFNGPQGEPFFLWNVRFIDVKGCKTPMYKLKKKQVEALYGIIIEEE